MSEKTHYRKAFDSPYLSSADLTGPVNLTVERVQLEIDKSKKTKDKFNTVYFAEKELRPDEPLKPMIFNATNSKMMKQLTNTPFIEDWAGTIINVFVDPNVRFGRETVEGLRIRKAHVKQELKQDTPAWNNAIIAYKRDGNFDAIEKRMTISDENKKLIKESANADSDK